MSSSMATFRASSSSTFGRLLVGGGGSHKRTDLPTWMPSLTLPPLSCHVTHSFEYQWSFLPMQCKKRQGLFWLFIISIHNFPLSFNPLFPLNFTQFLFLFLLLSHVFSILLVTSSLLSWSIRTISYGSFDICSLFISSTTSSNISLFNFTLKGSHRLTNVLWLESSTNLFQNKN